MLSALLNASVASDWILTGRRVTPEEARQVGFLHRVVEDGEAFNETLDLARDLVKKNRELLIKTKRVVKRQFNEKMRSEWWSEAEQLRREVGKHPDHKEALIRFRK
jgi:enoyl-CoA hydratase/carnithine racemase